MSIIYAFAKIYPKDDILINLKNTNTIVNIKFSNIFKEIGCIGVAVNEYFDSELGILVSPETEHGFFIKEILGGKHELFDKAVTDSLQNKKFISNEREKGKQQKYPIGTTAVLEFGERKYLLFALSETNDKYEAHTKPNLIIEAICGLLEKARSECNGLALNIPLVGTGLSRSGIPPKYLVDLMLISILKTSKDSEITKKINIVIENDQFNKIDLNELERKWN
jgi:hypothetical protein